MKHHIMRKNILIFNFLENSQILCLDRYNNLIISCNGFAEFLSELELRKLYKDIFKFSQDFKGNVNIVLPFGNKNKKQETLGKKIGFQFKTKAK